MSKDIINDVVKRIREAKTEDEAKKALSDAKLKWKSTSTINDSAKGGYAPKTTKL